MRIAPFGAKRRFATVQKFGSYREDSGHAAKLNTPNTVRFYGAFGATLLKTRSARTYLQSSAFKFVINLKTAKSLCLTIVLIRKSVAFPPPDCANNAPFRSM
jgi:hypothetical protein